MNTSLSVTNLRANAAQTFPVTPDAKANQNDDPVIIKPEVLQSGNLSLSTSHSTLIRFVQANTTASTTFAEGIKLSNVIDCLKSTQNFNSEMKTIVLKHIEKSTSADKKITTLEKGLEFLETEQKLSNLVNKNQMPLNIAKEILTKCLDLGCQKDFDLGKLREFNTFLDTSEGKNVSEKLGELFNHSEVNHQPVALQSQTEATEEISHSSISLNTDEKDLKKATFAKLGECFEGSNKSAIQETIQDLINKNNGEIDKKLLGNIQKTLEKNFGIDKNQSQLHILTVHQAAQKFHLVMLTYFDIILIDAGNGQFLFDGLQQDRFLLIQTRDLQDLFRHGGRKQQCLSFRRELRQNFIDIFTEAHLQHFIRLIQDHHAKMFHLQRMTTKVIHNAARRSHDDLRSLFQSHDLTIDGLTSIKSQYAHTLFVFRHLTQFFRHLDGQFSGGT